MGKFPQFISIVVSFLCLLHHIQSQDEEMNADNIKQESLTGNCLARDGRDGLPGSPGVHGPMGKPGRDGRDCINTLSMARIVELEKRLGQLELVCQFLETEEKKMKKNIEVYRRQTEKWMRILAAKKMIDLDSVEEVLELEQFVNQTSTETPFLTEKNSVARNPFESEDIFTGRIPANEETPTTMIPTEEIPKTEIPNEEILSPEIATEEIPTAEIPTEEIPLGSGVETTAKTRTAQAKNDEKSRRYYVIVKNWTMMKQTVGSVTKSSVSDDDTSAKKVCKKLFHFQQSVNTRGAVNMEVFNIGNYTFLAVANFHVFRSKDGYKTKSFIYRMNTETDLFEKFQDLRTIGCRALVSFSVGGDSYLVAANHYDGVRYDLNSVVYKWSGTQFEQFLEVQTFGASDVEFFNIEGESYLLFVNYRNTTSVSVPSVIYKWRSGNLELFQNLQTHGAVDCMFFKSNTHGTFLVFANFYSPEMGFNVESTVYKWNGQRFIFRQNIQVPAAISVDIFEKNGLLFLALASNRRSGSWHSHSVIFRWNGQSFVIFQKLTTTAAVKVHNFVDVTTSALYLTIANYFDEITDFEAHSVVYKFDGQRFVKFQGILTTGAYDLQPFTYKGVPYLASAFRFNGRNSSLHSKIYKMTTSCEATDDLLP